MDAQMSQVAPLNYADRVNAPRNNERYGRRAQIERVIRAARVRKRKRPPTNQDPPRGKNHLSVLAIHGLGFRLKTV